jgi:glycosyltransferase involved in cell wall biosynthesis
VVIGERSAKSSFFTSLKGHVIKYLLRFADHLVCNSQNATEMWREYAPRYSHKIECIYNLINDITPESKYIPLEYGRVNVVVAASYQPLKNMHRLILAIANLSAEERRRIHIDWYGQIYVADYGTKPYDDALALIQENNLVDVISLNPPVKNIYDYMHKADAIALVSEVEGLPNVICEALMLGKPVIMSNVSFFFFLLIDIASVDISSTACSNLFLLLISMFKRLVYSSIKESTSAIVSLNKPCSSNLNSLR